MKRIVAIAIVAGAALGLALAGEKVGSQADRDVAHVRALADREVKASKEAGESGDTWKAQIAEWRADRETLNARIANCEASYILATNKIAEATTVGKCQTAMEKLAKLAADQQQCITSLKQMIVDLKRATNAELAREK
jgi:septation ring formation regulator EzrA